ncbi:hypothetical protein MPSEU_000189900 [Mayamaea pseudoterrestris]|nr:hypothetical protein MPSEU_000189900 [Mayamaea pseudoterrestris]
MRRNEIPVSHNQWDKNKRGYSGNGRAVATAEMGRRTSSLHNNVNHRPAKLARYESQISRDAHGAPTAAAALNLRQQQLQQQQHPSRPMAPAAQAAATAINPLNGITKPAPTMLRKRGRAAALLNPSAAPLQKPPPAPRVLMPPDVKPALPMQRHANHSPFVRAAHVHPNERRDSWNGNNGHRNSTNHGLREGSGHAAGGNRLERRGSQEPTASSSNPAGSSHLQRPPQQQKHWLQSNLERNNDTSRQQSHLNYNSYQTKPNGGSLRGQEERLHLQRDFNMPRIPRRNDNGNAVDLQRNQHQRSLQVKREGHDSPSQTKPKMQDYIKTLTRNTSVTSTDADSQWGAPPRNAHDTEQLPAAGINAQDVRNRQGQLLPKYSRDSRCIPMRPPFRQTRDSSLNVGRLVSDDQASSHDDSNNSSPMHGIEPLQNDEIELPKDLLTIKPPYSKSDDLPPIAKRQKRNESESVSARPPLDQDNDEAADSTATLKNHDLACSSGNALVEPSTTRELSNVGRRHASPPRRPLVAAMGSLSPGNVLALPSSERMDKSSITKSRLPMKQQQQQQLVKTKRKLHNHQLPQLQEMVTDNLRADCSNKVASSRTSDCSSHGEDNALGQTSSRGESLELGGIVEQHGSPHSTTDADTSGVSDDLLDDSYDATEQDAASSPLNKNHIIMTVDSNHAARDGNTATAQLPEAQAKEWCNGSNEERDDISKLSTSSNARAKEPPIALVVERGMASVRSSIIVDDSSDSDSDIESAANQRHNRDKVAEDLTALHAVIECHDNSSSPPTSLERLDAGKLSSECRLSNNNSGLGFEDSRTSNEERNVANSLQVVDDSRRLSNDVNAVAIDKQTDAEAAASTTGNNEPKLPSKQPDRAPMNCSETPNVFDAFAAKPVSPRKIDVLVGADGAFSNENDRHPLFALIDAQQRRYNEATSPDDKEFILAQVIIDLDECGTRILEKGNCGWVPLESPRKLEFLHSAFRKGGRQHERIDPDKCDILIDENDRNLNESQRHLLAASVSARQLEYNCTLLSERKKAIVLDVIEELRECGSRFLVKVDTYWTLADAERIEAFVHSCFRGDDSDLHQHHDILLQNVQKRAKNIMNGELVVERSGNAINNGADSVFSDDSSGMSSSLLGAGKHGAGSSPDMSARNFACDSRRFKSQGISPRGMIVVAKRPPTGIQHALLSVNTQKTQQFKCSERDQGLPAAKCDRLDHKGVARTEEATRLFDFPHDPIFETDCILNPLEMQLLWLGEESMFSMGEAEFQFDFIYAYATKALRVEIRKLNLDSSESAKICQIIRSDWQVRRRFKDGRVQIRKMLNQGYRRQATGSAIAQIRVSRRLGKKLTEFPPMVHRLASCPDVVATSVT